jgi:hypothetical protein
MQVTFLFEFNLKLLLTFVCQSSLFLTPTLGFPPALIVSSVDPLSQSECIRTAKHDSTAPPMPVR